MKKKKTLYEMFGFGGKGKKSTTSGLKPLDKSRMREYTHAEFPWEYREYTKYAKHLFPKAFKDENHFKSEYDKAPMRHLSDDELKHLDYSTAGSYMRPGHDNVRSAHADFSHRRDTKRIENDLLHGQSAPPIVLKHSKGLRILGGNTRLSMAAAHGYSMPVKIIDISDRH